jgi:hypothetical protein
VSEIVELEGEAASFVTCPPDDPNLWMLIQCGDMGKQEEFMPRRVIGFRTDPGEGAAPACFGLALYDNYWLYAQESEEAEAEAEQATANEHADNDHADNDHADVQKSTGSRCIHNSWAWRAWCSTRHAANPAYGGIPNFIRSLGCVIGELDYANELGIVHYVQDDYGFWQARNIERTVEKIVGHQAIEAAFVGALGDLLSSHQVESEIKRYPNFEHLEAEGVRNMPGHRSEPG